MVVAVFLASNIVRVLELLRRDILSRLLIGYRKCCTTQFDTLYIIALFETFFSIRYLTFLTLIGILISGIHITLLSPLLSTEGNRSKINLISLCICIISSSHCNINILCIKKCIFIKGINTLLNQIIDLLR